MIGVFFVLVLLVDDFFDHCDMATKEKEVPYEPCEDDS